MPQQLITIGAYVLLATAIFTLAHWVKRGVTGLMTVHRAALIFMAEHDLMAEDYCIRRNIQRHNMRAMAVAVAATQGDAHREKKNGKASGTGGGFHH